MLTAQKSNIDMYIFIAILLGIIVFGLLNEYREVRDLKKKSKRYDEE